MLTDIKNKKFITIIVDLFQHLKWQELSIGILASSFFINILALMLPLMMLQFFDRIIPNKSTQTLVILTVIVIVAILIENLLKLLRASVNHWSSARFEHKKSLKAFKTILNADLNEYNKQGTGVYLDKMNGLFSMKDFYGGQALSLLIDFPFILIYLLLITYIGGLIVLVPIAILITFISTAVILGNRLQNLLQSRKEDDDRRYNFIIEILSGIQTIKSYAIEPFMSRRHERLQLNTIENEEKVSRTNLDTMSFSQILMQATTLLIVSIGSIQVMKGHMSVGSLAACTLLTNRTLSPLSSAMMYWKRIQSISISNQRLDQINNIKIQQTTGNEKKGKINGEIELKNLNFGFDENNHLLENVSISIKPKECIAIIGEGSSGKTSLLKLILGLYQPNQGDVLIDQQLISNYDDIWIRQKIAYLPQQSNLFNGNIIENLTLFNKNDIPRAVALVQQLNLQEKIHQLIDGYETPVGNTVTETLPAGIKQQLITVQNLIHDPDIILFDEANTAVDLETDKQFTKLLEYFKGKKTLIIVSHRPSIQKLADRKFRLIHRGLIEERWES